MTTDALAPCITRSSAATILAMWNRQVLVFHEGGFQLPVSYRCGGMTENCRYIFCFCLKILHVKSSSGAPIWWALIHLGMICVSKSGHRCLRSLYLVENIHNINFLNCFYYLPLYVYRVNGSFLVQIKHGALGKYMANALMMAPSLILGWRLTSIRNHIVEILGPFYLRNGIPMTSKTNFYGIGARKIWFISDSIHHTKPQQNHDDVTTWKHFPRNWPFVRGIHRSPVNSPHKGQWRAALMFSLICVWINDWVNNREAGDVRRYLAHYDVIVMHRLYVLLLGRPVSGVRLTHCIHPHPHHHPTHLHPHHHPTHPHPHPHPHPTHPTSVHRYHVDMDGKCTELYMVYVVVSVES